MSFDLKITGGTVIDGSGAEGRRADVAVKDGVIVEIGDCVGAAARVIDAAYQPIGFNRDGVNDHGMF
jgi:N-acyl-D-aspartate/D-glutamate deacylase